MILIPDLVGGTDRLDLLQSLSGLSDKDENLPAHIQDEAIALVHRRHGQVDLSHTDVLLSLDVEQTLLSSGICLHLVESTGHASGQVSNTVLVVSQEHLGLVILHLTMLDGGSVQQIVQLHGHDGSSSGLVLGGLRSQPEVHVPREVPAFVLFGLWEFIVGGRAISFIPSVTY